MGRLSPAECRRAAETRFSAAQAGRRWVDLVERVARSARPRAIERVELVTGLGPLEPVRAE